MTTKKTLILTRDFPPYCNRVGWFARSAALANYLSENGVRVHVICFKRFRHFPGIYKVDDRVQILPFSHPLTLYDMPGSSLHPLGLPTKLTKRVLGPLVKRNSPDWEEIAHAKLFRKTLNLLRNEQIRNLIISTPPHCLQRIGVNLKRTLGDSLTLIADYRDPWTLRPRYDHRTNTMNTKMRKRELESFEAADHIVFVSAGMRQMYEDLFGPRFGNKITVIENGFTKSDSSPDPDVVSFVSDARQERRVILGYFGVGTVNSPAGHPKDLSVLFEVLKDRFDLASRFALVAQGDFQIFGGVPHGLKVLRKPPTSNATARANMQLVDVGLFVYTVSRDAPLVMGGKVYDYMGSEIAVWCLVPSNAWSLQSLAAKKGKIFFSDVESREDVLRIAIEIIELFDEGKLQEHKFREAEVVEYRRENQYKKFLELLKAES